jgi:hypothetical protein
MYQVKWPMGDVGDKLYNYLDALRNDWPKLKVLHDNVRAVSCWFDYLQPSHPWLGFLNKWEMVGMVWWGWWLRQVALSFRSRLA